MASRVAALIGPGAFTAAFAALLFASSVFLYGYRRTLGDDVLAELGVLVLVVFLAQRVSPRRLSLADPEPRFGWRERAATAVRGLLLGYAAFFFVFEAWTLIAPLLGPAAP